MRRVTLLFFAAFCFAAGVIDGAPGEEGKRLEPWEWKTADRIAARLDARLAAERVAAHQRTVGLAVGTGPQIPSTRRVVDVIDGKQHPELFLPTELFEWLINRGLMDDWVDYTRQARAAGLPTDFWKQLKVAVDLYVRDVADRNRLTQSRGEDSQKALAALSATMCRDRAAALAIARRMFGVSIDRFMYQYVAPSLTKSTDESPDANALQMQESGCR